jgi:hypothetical protein
MGGSFGFPADLIPDDGSAEDRRMACTARQSIGFIYYGCSTHKTPSQPAGANQTWNARSHPIAWNVFGIYSIIAGDFNRRPGDDYMYLWDDLGFMNEGHLMDGNCHTHATLSNPPPFVYRKIDYMFSHRNRSNPAGYGCTRDHPDWNGYLLSSHYYIWSWFNVF